MSDVLIVTGAVLVVGGVGWMYPPAAVVMAGIMLMTAGVMRGLNE